MLSEHEKQVLDEIEQAMGIDSPCLVSSWASARRHWCPGKRPTHVAALPTGLGLLVTGLTVFLLGVHADTGLGVVVVLVGYLVIVAAVRVGCAALRGPRQGG